MNTDPVNKETTAEELREKIQLNTTYRKQLRDINRLLLEIIENEEKTGMYQEYLRFKAEQDAKDQESPP